MLFSHFLEPAQSALQQVPEFGPDFSAVCRARIISRFAAAAFGREGGERSFAASARRQISLIKAA